MSHSTNVSDPATRRDNFRVVGANGAMLTPAAITAHHKSLGRASAATAPVKLDVAGCDVDWGAKHDTNSTYGEGNKKPAIEAGKIFSNAVNEYFDANPNCKKLRAMAQEFEQAFVEAAKNPS